MAGGVYGPIAGDRSRLKPKSGDNAPGTDEGPHGMDVLEPRLWTCAPEWQIGGLATKPSKWIWKCSGSTRRAEPPHYHTGGGDMVIHHESTYSALGCLGAPRRRSGSD